jgi:hypothetical protein
MTKKLKLSAWTLLAAAATVTAQAQTNLLQSVTVAFTYFSQGAPVPTSTGTNNVVNKNNLTTKELIGILSPGGFQSGDVLARATPVTNVPVTVTNLSTVSTTNLVITNTNPSLESPALNAVLFGSTSNYIGTTNVTFGTNIVAVDGTNVTMGTNSVTIGTNVLIPVIGTNTTVTTTILTNAFGNSVGTNYAFVINALVPGQTTTNKLGTASWVIYNPANHGTITPISTNLLFNIYTDTVYDDGTNLAYMHGENIKKNGVIQFGTTDEIRALVLSNSTWNIKARGYAHGHVVAVSLGGSDVVYSQDYLWDGSGSGVISNTPIVIDGLISEQYFKMLK